MITVVTAPEKINFPDDAIKIFLAGGIQKCGDWQKSLVEYFRKNNFKENIYLINPRRDNFPIDNPNAAEEQITWEFEMLEQCDMFTMCFNSSESDQPICFYELGRNIEKMKQRFPLTWMNRIAVTCDKNFKRCQDVVIQTRLATNSQVEVNLSDSENIVPSHFQHIIEKKSLVDEIRFADKI